MQQLAQAALGALEVEVSFRGIPPREGFLACNHLSYFDILVLASRQPVVFVSKSEVRTWPLIGLMARFGGTIFLNRQKKRSVSETLKEFEQVLAAQIVIVLFLEGTSSDGRSVLPFRSSLLEPATNQGLSVTPAAIGYSLQDGSVGDEVCYWGEMTFLPHLLNALRKTSIQAFVTYGNPPPSGMSRKELARELHREVSALAAYSKASSHAL